MIQYLILARGRLHAFFAAARSAVCLSRILLLIVAVEAVTMPITQGIWSWDKFLHGGQDFELGLLIIITCLCLVLLRVQQNRSRFGWLAVIRMLLLNPHKRAAETPTTHTVSFEHRSQIPSPLRAPGFNVPLLI